MNVCSAYGEPAFDRSLRMFINRIFSALFMLIFFVYLSFKPRRREMKKEIRKKKRTTTIHRVYQDGLELAKYAIKFLVFGQAKNAEGTEIGLITWNCQLPVEWSDQPFRIAKK